MLSKKYSEWHQLVYLYSTIKLTHGPIKRRPSYYFSNRHMRTHRHGIVSGRTFITSWYKRTKTNRVVHNSRSCRTCHEICWYNKEDDLKIFNLTLKHTRSEELWDVNENSALLDHRAACSGNSLPKFRDSKSVPSSGIENFWTSKILYPWRRDRYVVPKRRQGITTTRYVIANKSAVFLYLAAEAWIPS